MLESLHNHKYKKMSDDHIYGVFGKNDSDSDETDDGLYSNNMSSDGSVDEDEDMGFRNNKKNKRSHRKKSKKFDIQLQRLEREKNAIKEQFDKKIASAVKSAEARAKREVNSLLKEKIQESIKAQVEKATLKTQEGLLRATRTIEATKKQMSTLQQNNLKQQQQNLKQQDRIKNLEIQLKNQTTPQLEGFLYEDKLIEIFIGR